jgi:DNA-binding IclR family transcriptional regulator
VVLDSTLDPQLERSRPTDSELDGPQPVEADFDSALDELEVALGTSAVRSVDRAAALLLALGDVDEPAGVTDLSRRLGLHKSTASRLLTTLERRGLVEQDDETGKYRLGIAVIRLAHRAEQTLDVGRLALPDLERLARAAHDPASLGVLDGDRVSVVAQGDPPSVAAIPDWTGRRLPLHATAAGKVLLAAVPERDVLRIVRAGLREYTPRTITALEPMLEELARVRRRGFAVALGELEAGLHTIAAPVHDGRNAIVAAVELRASALRLPVSRLPELASAVRDTASAVTARLGGVSA